MAGAHKPVSVLGDEPLWYKDAVIYELHVRAFADSDGDGVGDFRGLTANLGYLQDLGVTAIWLLPFYPSPLKDDGYDIADYTTVHPDYGTLGDFKAFLRGAHSRGLRVITELVVNHTSDQHPWFKRARRAAPGSRWRDFYVWSDSAERYADARIIFQDFESSNWTWDPVARAYYWHRFYSHQPDLNYDNPRVREAVLKAMDFWLDLGVDGMRLDAVPYLYERDGTTCENLPETHAFLKELRAHVDERHSGRMLLAEANQWPEDAIAYFGEGDECHMAFHFPVMPRLFMAVHMEDRFPVVDIMEQTPAIPEGCQWALFLRNHDELTLEMVTDEERDYMYRVYASDPKTRLNVGIRRRLAPLLGNNRRQIELLNGILFALPGTPIIYYGDEIGMGDNFYLGDRNGVRTPMQWSPDRNAGFSRANPQRLYLPTIIDPEYHFEAVNVESQQANSHSLLWWMRRLIAMRRRLRALGRGSLEMLLPDNPKILAFVRRWEGDDVLVVANLSRFVQYVELDLSAAAGAVPVEVFGLNEFPPVGEDPYVLTLGPHAFFWFSLSRPEPSGAAQAQGPVRPSIAVSGSWQAVLSGRARTALEDRLAEFVSRRRWFGGKARRLKGVSVTGSIPFTAPGVDAAVLLVRAEYAEGEPETYVLPLAMAAGDEAGRLEEACPEAVVTAVTVTRGAGGVLYDAMCDPRFEAALLDAVARRRRFKGGDGELVAAPTRAFRSLGGAAGDVEPRLLRSEQSNTSVAYGQRFVLKVFRRLEPGVNPDLEIGRYLTQRGFTNVPAVAGALEYRVRRGESSTVALLQAWVPNQGDAWQYTLDELRRYFERVGARTRDGEAPLLPSSRPRELLESEAPEPDSELLATYLDSAWLLGRRTGELHLALGAPGGGPAFEPEPFTALVQRSVHQGMRSLADRVFPLLRRRLRTLPEDAVEDARAVIALREAVLDRFTTMLAHRITAQRTRCHGDFHLGQVLFTGKDFVIIDFEGEPARPVGERRIKRSPLRDVAGMLRSFDYAGHTALFSLLESGHVDREAARRLQPWVRFWTQRVGASFLKSYLDVVRQAAFIPAEDEVMDALLEAYLLEKAIYELGYELNNRPGWVRIPLRGILALLGEA